MPRLALLLCLAAAPALAQIDPPAGPVGPSFKSLDEVEPRIPLSDATTPGDEWTLYIITEPGSYYLTGGVMTEGKSAIRIESSDVTVDLMGYGVRGSGAGIGVFTYEGPYDRVTVRNGFVTGFGRSGVDLTYGNAPCTGGLVEGVHAANNHEGGIVVGRACIVRACTAAGNGGTGIALGAGSVAEQCAARVNALSGIGAGEGSTLRDCAASGNGYSGISAGKSVTLVGCSAVGNGQDGMAADTGSSITDCTARENADDGIYASIASRVTGCVSRENGDDGFVLGGGSTISGCNASENTGDGISLVGDTHAQDNTCYRNGRNGDGAGIHAVAGGGGNRIEGNALIDNDRGLDIDTTGNLVFGNSAQGNGVAYDIVANNKVGTIVVAPNSGAISGSTGGSGLGTTNPWANLMF